MLNIRILKNTSTLLYRFVAQKRQSIPWSYVFYTYVILEATSIKKPFLHTTANLKAVQKPATLMQSFVYLHTTAK